MQLVSRGRWYAAVAPGPGKAHGEGAEAFLYRCKVKGWEVLGLGDHPMRLKILGLVTDPARSASPDADVLRGDV